MTGLDAQLEECPRLGAKLLLRRCIDRHMGRAPGLSEEARAVCAQCPLGAHRATAAGERIGVAAVGGGAGGSSNGTEQRLCANPDCQHRAREGSRYCGRPCKMAVDRVRARIIDRRRKGQLREADDLQSWLDGKFRERGWSTPSRIHTPEKVRTEIEILFGEPLVLDGQRIWLSHQVWRGLGYSSPDALRNLLRRSFGRDVVDGQDTWVLRQQAGDWQQAGDLGDVVKGVGRIKLIPPLHPSIAFTRVYTELGLWKLCLLSRTAEAIGFRGRLFEGWQTVRAYWEQAGAEGQAGQAGLDGQAAVREG